MPSSRYLFGTLPWYSVLIVTGMALAIWLAMREEKRLRLPKDTILDLALWALPLGVLGARLYYVAFRWDIYAGEPLRILAVWEGGLAIYGGIIGGFLAVLLFTRRRRLSLPLLLDVLCPGVALAQGLGRWGNFFNMEAYGEVITNPALQFFPIGVLIPEGEALVWHQATFFYESVLDILIFICLWGYRTHKRRDGEIFWLYLLLYGAGRMLIEGLRTDSLMTGTIRVSQALSGALCCAAMVALMWHTAPRWLTIALGVAAGGLLLALTVQAFQVSWGLLALFAAAMVLPPLLTLLPGGKHANHSD